MKENIVPPPRDQISKAWELFVSNENFEMSLMQIGLKLASIQLSGDNSADEEIKWFSGIAKDLITDKANCNLSDDEKFHFIAMHQTFLKI